MACKVLLVEDNQYKRERITSYLLDTDYDMDVITAHSFTTGCQNVTSNDFDLIILDMSLPTYDKSDSEVGGKFRPFGGKEIARKIKRRGIKTKLIIITQYDSFSDRGRSHSLESLREELEIDLAENIESIIYYDTTKSSWKEELSQSLTSILGKL